MEDVNKVNKVNDRRQKTEDRRQKTEDKIKTRNQKPEND